MIRLFTFDALNNIYEVFDGTQASISKYNSLMAETTPTNYKVTIHIRAETLAPVYAFQKFDLLVCGQEEVLPIMDTLLFVFDKDSGS
jgi:hypothetical protein